MSKGCKLDLSDRQLLITDTFSLVVRERGRSLDDVTGKLFQRMRKDVFREVGRPIVHLVAEEVYFEDVEVKEWTERFLFLFWPRTRKELDVSARIVVRVSYLDIEEGDL